MSGIIPGGVGAIQSALKPAQPKPQGSPLDNILGSMGVGNYRTADGQTIMHGDLPPEVQAEVERLAAQRGQGPEYQQRINQLYDPASRGQTMQQLQAERIAQELNSRLSQRDAGRR